MRRLIVSTILMAATTAHAEDTLDRAAIADGVAKVKPKVMACASGAKIGGTVKLAVTVAADGKVTKALPTANDKDLGTCVAAAMLTATFPATTIGGSFSYPFVFDAAKQPPPDQPDGPSFPKDASDPDSIDRDNIMAVVGILKPRIRKCADKSKIGGSLRVRITVKPDGRVASATHENANDPKLGQCIVAVFKTAKFSRSQKGGVFTYPFNFGTTTADAPQLSTGELDRATISAGVAKAKTAIAACGDRIKTGGTVTVKVSVGADGHVTSAAQDGTLTDLGTCVVDVMKTILFGKTTSGGSFSYPFVFGPPVAAPAVVDALDRAAISEGVAKAKPQISACATSSTPKGTVKLKVVVAPSGVITNVVVDATPDAALGACVASAMQKVVFRATKQGGSFSYPFVF